MPAPLVLGAIGAGLSGAVSLIQSAKDGKKSRAAEREMDQLMEDRPEYERPGEVNQSLGLAIARYGDGRMPGAETARRESQLLAANTATAAAAGGDPFGAALGAQARADSTNRGIAVDEAGYRIQQEQNLAARLDVSAGYTDQEFQMNDFAPWADALTRATNDFRDYRESSRKGLSEGLSSLSTLGIGLMGGMGGGSKGAAGGTVIDDIISTYSTSSQNPAKAAVPDINGWISPWAEVDNGILG